MPSQIVLKCSKALAEKKLTLAFAESVTSGRMAAEFALCPESGSVLRGGLVCYDAFLKETILHVPKDMLRTFTPESAEVTKELAERLQNFIPADIHVGVTGLATPGGSETEEKPVGTIFLHIYMKGKSVAGRRVCKGNPEEVILAAVDFAAEMLLGEIPQ
jgi:nicotinamide-nucleotide amidase